MKMVLISNAVSKGCQQKQRKSIVDMGYRKLQDLVYEPENKLKYTADNRYESTC
jgi:hypothetical protein